MYKLEFTLKQHTPLIHFQHDQAGATLRATEVKPKLDKFIIEVCNKQGIDYKKWLIGDGEHDALDYKIRIAQPANIKYYLPLALPPNTQNYPNRGNKLIEYIRINLKIDIELIAPSPYFANSDKIKFRQNEVDLHKTKLSELRFAVKTDEPFKVYITGFDQELLENIKENIELFFLLHNFGTRQSKGFGCFMTIEPFECDTNLFDYIPTSFGLDGIYYKDYQELNNQTFFKVINDFWKILKAGTSFGHYEKSDIFNYYYHLTPPIRWEKRAIKKEIKAYYPDIFSELKYDTDRVKNNRILTESDTQNNHFFIRALLGLAENNEYGTFSNADKVKIQISDKLSKNDKTKIKAIDRLKSPITFKIIDNRIYMVVFKINALLQTDIDGNDREFEFILNATINGVDTSGLLATLKIPKNFSVVQFLDSSKYITSSGLKNSTSIAQTFGFIKL